MTTIRARLRHRAAAALATAAALVVVTGCVADPPPPTVVGGEEGGGNGTDVSLTSDGLLLALDRVESGFNPHLLSDQGVDTDLVASLLLPSAFVPGPDGSPVLNTALLVSAAPLPDSPETVRYTINPKAQWSDGVPVAAEDFEYLWRQMVTQPGVVDPAGYERITAVRPGAGGKIVDVVFDSVPEHWRSLFHHLLPGHILKGAPDGFAGAMENLPVMSAGPFMIRAADIGRGEIEFVRNDRYWADVPGPTQIVTRRESGPGQLGAALRDGPGVLALVAGSPVSSDVAATVPGVSSRDVAASAQLEVGFNTVAPAVSDQRVRRALAAALDPAVVGRIITGESEPSVTSYPFPGSSATTVTGDPDVVRDQLEAAGFSRPDGQWQRGSEQLAVTLGVEADDERARAAAYLVADQLHGAGIGAVVWELDPTALYADALPHGLVDATVGWQAAEGNAEVSALSRFACVEPAGGTGGDTAVDGSGNGTNGTDGADTDSDGSSGSDQDRDTETLPARPRTTVSSIVPPTSTQVAPHQGSERETAAAEDAGEAGDEAGSGAGQDAESTATTTTPTTPPRTLGADAPARAADTAGICDTRLDAALGVGPEPVDLAEAGDLVGELALRVPLVRPTMLLADDGVHTSGREPGTEPRTVTEFFDSAPTWKRTE